MVHSTGANNPNLKRYVGPNDGLLGENQYGNHWNQDKPDGQEVCPHAFISKLADGSIATYQVLPWDYRGQHCGSGWQDALMAAFIAIVQGILCAGCSAYINQLGKQANKVE